MTREKNSCQARQNSSEIRTFKSHAEDSCLRSVQILALVTQFSPSGCHGLAMGYCRSEFCQTFYNLGSNCVLDNGF